jgi:hypothetical protein
MDPVEAAFRGVIFIAIVLAFWFCWRIVKAVIRTLIKALSPHSLGKASAVVQAKATTAVEEFKAGRRSGS